jgi:hypothetical protein
VEWKQIVVTAAVRKKCSQDFQLYVKAFFVIKSLSQFPRCPYSSMLPKYTFAQYWRKT